MMDGRKDLDNENIDKIRCAMFLLELFQKYDAQIRELKKTAKEEVAQKEGQTELVSPADK